MVTCCRGHNCHDDNLSCWRVVISTCCHGDVFIYGDVLYNMIHRVIISDVMSCHGDIYIYSLHGDVLGFHGNNCYDEHL